MWNDRPDPIPWEFGSLGSWGTLGRWCWPPQAQPGIPSVELWFADLDQWTSYLGDLHGWLTATEQARADRFHTPQLAQRFIGCRGILRGLLAQTLGIPPETIAFTYNDRGKPQLAPGLASQPLEFNLSHSQNLVLYGFSTQPLGVDLEHLNQDRQGVTIARRFFSPSEVAVLESFGDSPEERSHQQQAFLRHWVCKEAYVKATGQGLAQDLRSIAVSFQPHAQIHLTQPEPISPSPSFPWQVAELTPSPHSVGALVVATLPDC